MTDPAPLSKTAKYKKITKPLLERKRRARINRCLDELKDLMVGALESKLIDHLLDRTNCEEDNQVFIDDDNLSKLEKADILELTVNHLTKLHSPKDPVLETKKFQAGFGQCAAEACRFIMSVPDLDSKVSQNLISHLSRLITVQPLTIQVPERPPFSPPTSPVSVISDRQHYYSDHERSSSDAEDSVYSGDGAPKQCKWGYSRQNPHATRKPASTMTGLLTTVDKLTSHQPEQMQGSGHRHGQYFNKVPAEAKDVILQKIRQHIMDKRGNENCNVDVISNIDESDPRYSYKNDSYRNEVMHQYSPVNVPSSETLDLRKFRSPSKSSETACSPKKTVAYPAANQSDTIPLTESKVEVKPNLPEQCELPMDYSNLPPKKKRKLIEYQEYKKQEEARRQLEAFYEEKKRHGGPPDEDAKWRPW